jgi:23S rRNA (uridine2552-2'-O)-methyltransferase
MKRNRWDDHYARKARSERWLARSVFKLQQIDKKLKLIHPREQVLDLGCYPGSWSQYATKMVGTEGEVVGIDLVWPEHFSAPNFKFIQADVFTLDGERLSQEIGGRNVVLSDLAPRTTGIAITDVAESMKLAKQALQTARALLKRKGRFLCKIFEGEGLNAFRSEASESFEQAQLLRPSAVRKGSREIYLVGLGFLR